MNTNEKKKLNVKDLKIILLVLIRVHSWLVN